MRPLKWRTIAGISLLTICVVMAIFMTAVPIQTYWGKEHAPEQYGCLDIAFLGPPPVQESYHVLRGELDAYQQAKHQVDQNPQYYLCSNGAHRIKLFL